MYITLKRNFQSYNKCQILKRRLAYLVTPLQYNMVRYFSFLQPLRKYFKALSLQKWKCLQKFYWNLKHDNYTSIEESWKYLCEHLVQWNITTVISLKTNTYWLSFKKWVSYAVGVGCKETYVMMIQPLMSRVWRWWQTPDRYWILRFVIWNTALTYQYCLRGYTHRKISRYSNTLSYRVYTLAKDSQYSNTLSYRV